MARQAVTLIIFMFLVCLSCLCSSAMGGGLFYACSDGSMKTDKFDLKKCLNFGMSDVKTVVTGDVKETETKPESTPTSDEPGDDLLPPQPIDDEAADPNLSYLDYFDRGTQSISGVGVAVTATNTAECAKMCFNDEESMPNEGEKCQGFVSDDANYCKLYPSIDVSSVTMNSKHKAYRLKEGKEGGGAIKMFSLTSHSTNYGPDGGPKYYGNRHNLDCNGGGMTSFKWNKSGGLVNNSYTCLKSDTAFGGVSSKMTPHNSSGKRTGYNDMYYMDRHDINCGDNFLSQWQLAQWSRSMRFHYKCTNAKTPKPDECEVLTVSDFPHHPHAGQYANKPIKCPANKILTQWKYNNDGTLNFRCCPKPV